MNYQAFTGMTCLILSCLFWAGNYVLCKLLVVDTAASPVAIVFWRFLLGGVLMLLIALPTLGWRCLCRVSFRDLTAIAGQGICGMGLTSVLILISERYTSAINVTMLEALIPVCVLLGGALLGMPLRRIQFLGMGLALLGCLLVIRALNFAGFQLTAFDVGDLYVLLAALTWTVYVLWGRKTQEKVNSSVYTVWSMLATALTMGLYAGVSGTGLDYPTDDHALGLMALLVLFPSTGAYLCWNQACRTVPLPLLNIIQYLIPVSAVIMAHFVLHEGLDGLQILGMSLILSGIVLDPHVRSGIAHRFRRQHPELPAGRE